MTPSQLALAWVMAQGEDIVPIPGTKRRKYLEENARAAGIQLAPQIVNKLNEEFPPEAVAGTRYAPQMLALLNQ